jgi:hypothetical protein
MICLLIWVHHWSRVHDWQDRLEGLEGASSVVASWVESNYHLECLDVGEGTDDADAVSQSGADVVEDIVRASVSLLFVSKIDTNIVKEEPTGSWWYLEHLRSLGTSLHVHHRGLLVTLLRALVAHHWRAGSRAVGVTIRARNARHMPWILRICRAGCWRVHLHLWVTWHAHIRPVGGLVRHHVAAHCGAWRTDELAGLRTTQTNVLHVRTHTILRHLYLLLVAWHRLWLSTIGIRRHWSGRWVHG